MLRKLMAAWAIALGLLVLPSPFETADAKRLGVRTFHAGHMRTFRAPRFHAGRVHIGRVGRVHIGRHLHRRHARHFRRGIYLGVPLAVGAYYYGSGYYYGNGCSWLRRRALATGSPYWWERYYACRDRYY